MNSKTILLAIAALLLTTISATFASAEMIPVSVDSVRIDGIVVEQNSNTKLNIERNQDLRVEVRLTSSKELDNVQIQAFVSGFEYSDIEPVHDLTPVFSMSPNELYVKELNIKLSDLIQEDSYKLRLIISDRDNEQLIKEYSLKIDVPRHSVRIEDVLLTPDDSVKAGSSLLAKVRVGNKGEKTENDVKVSVSVPELGISASSYIAKVENKDKERQSEELFLRIPKCAKAGDYDINIVVEFDESHRKASQTRKIKVTEGACTETNKLSVSFPNNILSAKAGEQAVFSWSIENSGKSDKIVNVLVKAPEDVEVSVQPSAVVAVQKGQKQAFTLFATPEKAGVKSLSISLVSDNSVIAQTTATLNVSEKNPTRMIEILLIALVVVLALVAFIVFSGGRKNHSKKSKKVEKYY